MNPLARLDPAFTPCDSAAVVLLILSWALTGWVFEHPPARWPSVSHLMRDYRRGWMKEFITRPSRIFDATVIDSLRQGTAFFASASMIAIGGGVAMIGNAPALVGVAQDLALMTEANQLRLKIVLVVVFLANALLKFVWSNRLFGYCAVMMAAIPNDESHPLADFHASQVADINITAARGFNRGLHSIYFALGTLGWLLGPIALLASTVLTVAVVLRREFASVSRDVLLRKPPQ